MKKKNEVETGELEFLVTMHYLRKHLPATGKILDAGGGPGRYTLEFCRAGYDVIHLDIHATYTAFAEEKIKLEPKSVVSFTIVSFFSSKHIGIQLINERKPSIPVLVCFQQGSKSLKLQYRTFETLIITGHSLFQGIFRAGKKR